MHPHVVHNYLKDGYYPTDEATVRLIADKLVFKAGVQRLLDPCCGEGLALAQLAAESLCHEHSHLPTLKRDGVLALVMPFPSLTPAFCCYLSMRLREVLVFPAATDRFKQVVVLGRKALMRGNAHQGERSQTAQALMQVGQGERIPECLSRWFGV